MNLSRGLLGCDIVLAASIFRVKLECGGIKTFWNVSFLPHSHYTASQPRRWRLKSSSPWKLQSCMP